MTALLIFAVCFIVLAIIRVPLAYAMLGAALIGIVTSGLSLGMVASTAYSSIDVFAYLAIPGFIFAGDLMLHGKIAETMLDDINRLAKGAKSVLGTFAVILSMLFGTILGSSAATVGLVGGMLIPKMNKLGYPKEESAALICASGILGILIPPSIPGIMYAIAAGQSIMKVWVSTIMPALLLGPLWIVVNILRSKKITKTLDETETTKEEQRAALGKFSVRSIPAWLAPVVIFAGIFGGIFTPTEAGAVIVLYSLLIGWFVYKGLNRKNIFDITLQGAKNNAAIVVLIAFAAIAGRFFTFAGLPQQLAAVITGMNISKTVFLLLLNLILIVAGMFMETNTSILMLTPLLLPLSNLFGIDPVHFGAIMLLNLQLGMLTPPFAGNIFVVSKVAHVPFNKVLRPLVPYLLVAIPVLILTTYVPQFSLFLVNLMK